MRACVLRIPSVLSLFQILDLLMYVHTGAKLESARLANPSQNAFFKFEQM